MQERKDKEGYERSIKSWWVNLVDRQEELDEKILLKYLDNN
jgi:hypothetical protein